MNSAVDTLLKAINDLKNRVDTLEIKVTYLEWDISRLKDEVRRLKNELPISIPNTTSIPYWEYTWSSYTSETPTQCSRADSTASVQHISPNADWTLTVTYSDGTTQTINPVF